MTTKQFPDMTAEERQVGSRNKGDSKSCNGPSGSDRVWNATSQTIHDTGDTCVTADTQQPALNKQRQTATDVIDFKSFKFGSVGQP